MAYRYGDREQITFLPACIEEYIGPNDPVRAYDAFIDALNLEDLGICNDENTVGNPQYDPRSMLKLFVYGYSYSADRSSRKLERSLHHNLSFIWLLGGLKPDHKTIANFRRNNKAVLANVLKQSARMCLKMGIIEGNTLFVDGTKLRANASIKNTWDQKRIAEKLTKIDTRIEAILQECENLDNQENAADSLVTLKKELQDKRALKEKMVQITDELKVHNRKSLNTTDGDCVSTKSRHGSYAGYNAQIVVDEKNGLIASCDVVAASNDEGQLSQQIKNAQDVLEKKCSTAIADGGYSDFEDISKIDKDIEVLLPLNRQATGRENFIYNQEEDVYRCPEGHVLKPCKIELAKKSIRYKITNPLLCQKCPRYGDCTKGKAGRSMGRSFYEQSAERVQQNLSTKASKALYKLRAQRVEHPFGHLRRTLSVRSFLLRGVQGTKAEMSLWATAFNIRRMITILGGVQAFKAAVIV